MTRFGAQFRGAFPPACAAQNAYKQQQRRRRRKGRPMDGRSKGTAELIKSGLGAVVADSGPPGHGGADLAWWLPPRWY